jgi:hypothetical protein
MLQFLLFGMRIAIILYRSVLVKSELTLTRKWKEKGCLFFRYKRLWNLLENF